MKYFTLISAIILGALTTGLQGQLSKPGRYIDLVQHSLLKFGNKTQVREYLIPHQDNKQLLAQAQADEFTASVKLARKEIRKSVEDGADEVSYTSRPPKAVPFTFGKAVQLSVDINEPGQGDWIVNEETRTRMWRFRVSSKDAFSLSIYFSEFRLIPGSELYIIGGEETLGAFTSDNNKESGVFGITPVSGDFLILEYIEPMEEDRFAPSKSVLKVSHVVHGFRSNPFTLKSFNEAGKCNINVACPEGAGKIDSINSVALLLTQSGEAFCSGAMVNNTKQDGRQLFLTAEHCIGDSTVDNFMFGYNFQFKYCNSSLESKPQVFTVHGARLLNKTDTSDYALLEVVEKIPDNWDVFMSGWDATPSSSRTGSHFGIHHPSGDVKKVSLATGTLNIVRLTDMGQGINFWQISRWSRGVTEPGSSGSPLFDANGLIIGHLLGGDSSCSHQHEGDYYGALSADWSNPAVPISKHLDPAGLKNYKLAGASLKSLRSGGDLSEPVTENTSKQAPGPISTVTVTLSLPRTTTVTSTVTSVSTVTGPAQVVTSRATVSVTLSRSTVTTTTVSRETTTSITTKFINITPPPVRVTVTQTVRR